MWLECRAITNGVEGGGDNGDDYIWSLCEEFGDVDHGDGVAWG